MSKILFLVNQDTVVYNLRLELVERLLSEGHEVVISSPYGERSDELIKLGCSFEEISISRHGVNPIQELKLIAAYDRLVRRISPDIVLTYTIKPNIYGGLACRKNHIPYLVNITGLGMVVERGGIINKISDCLYRHALADASMVYFQNQENQKYFKDKGLVKNNYKLIPGSGVNLKRNPYEAYPDDKCRCKFLFVGRMMTDKGYTEYVEAAKEISRTNSNAEFYSIGFCEQEYKKKFELLSAEKYVHSYGEVKNVHDYIKDSNVVVLPSYHEGMSNALLEAAACGRPIIASQIPGCQETFDDNISGLSCKPKSASDLINAMNSFMALSYEQKRNMGIAGRIKMEKEFDRQIVVNEYCKTIDTVLRHTRFTRCERQLERAVHS